jgi:putative transposase
VGVQRVVPAVRSPRLNAQAERWSKSVKEQCLSQLMVFGENTRRRALRAEVAHYPRARTHQEIGKGLLRSVARPSHVRTHPIRDRDRLGGVCKYDNHEAA